VGKTCCHKTQTVRVHALESDSLGRANLCTLINLAKFQYPCVKWDKQCLNEVMVIRHL
jgi:hypothetical protein